MEKRRHWSGFTPMSKFTQHTSYWTCNLVLHRAFWVTQASSFLNGGKKWMHHDRDIDHFFVVLRLADLPQFLNTLNSENLSLHHTRQCVESVATRQFSAHLCAAPCAKWPPFFHPCSSITPTLHHIVLTTPSFDFCRLWVGASWLKKKTTVTSASPTDQQMKGAHQKQFRCLLRTCTHRKSGKPPSDRGHKASERWWGFFSTFLNNTQNKEAHKWTEGTPSFWRRHTMFKLWQMSKDSDRPTQTERETQGALTTHSHTIAPNTSLFSKVTARPCWEKRFLCYDNSRTRELLWHCENSERGEFCEFELTQHASVISWHKKAMAMWQLNATRPSSQSSKKRDTTSLDQFAQRLQERGYRRCARNLQKKTCPHFLPTQCHRCKQGFFGQPYLYMSLSSGEESPSNRRAFSSAIMWRPIKAHAFTVSAGMHGPSSTNSLRTIGSS